MAVDKHLKDSILFSKVIWIPFFTRIKMSRQVENLCFQYSKNINSPMKNNALSQAQGCLIAFVTFRSNTWAVNDIGIGSSDNCPLAVHSLTQMGLDRFSEYQPPLRQIFSCTT
ncbi:hypothetical protein TNCV_2948721 [Trichonephila clavipes]|nr:hypothetical protein TNCV_2948721 [Trichonephila clavipes]